MPRMIDQIRASKLPSHMMQFAARGALQVPPAENIEILVHLARHNKLFGELARLTLAGWDEKACVAVASDPQTPPEVLEYFIAHDNLRLRLLPALLENPSVPASEVTKLAASASQEAIKIMLKSERMHSLSSVLEALKTNPYLSKEDGDELQRLTAGDESPAAKEPGAPVAEPAEATAEAPRPAAEYHVQTDESEPEVVSAYLKEHAGEIVAVGDKPFQAIGGIVELLGPDYFPVTHVEDVSAPPVPGAERGASHKKPQPHGEPERQNTLQKIKSLDVKGRIQLALKGNKEERSILIRDGTKVVALAVLDAPKLSDGEVETFASQKNVLEAVLRRIPLKRSFMKDYVVVRNLVSNPRTPLDLGLGLMKNLLTQDLKNLSNNKEISETIRKLAMKMYKQKLESANRK